jgi:hypothetical protein
MNRMVCILAAMTAMASPFQPGAVADPAVERPGGKTLGKRYPGQGPELERAGRPQSLGKNASATVGVPVGEDLIRFDNPNFEANDRRNYPLHYCQDEAGDCGKAVAREYCQIKVHRDASVYSFDVKSGNVPSPNSEAPPGPVIVAVYIRTGQQTASRANVTFSQITCRTRPDPHRGGAYGDPEDAPTDAGRRSPEPEPEDNRCKVEPALQIAAQYCKIKAGVLFKVIEFKEQRMFGPWSGPIRLGTTVAIDTRAAIGEPNPKIFRYIECELPIEMKGRSR